MGIRKLTICVVIIFLLFCLTALAGIADFKSGSEPDGFRGIKWGTNISTLNNMECVERSDFYAFYTKKGDSLQVGGSQLKKIAYGFFDGKLSAVLVHTNGYVNYINLRDATFERFGKGARTDAEERLDIQDFHWDGPISGMALKYNQFKEEGTLYLFSKEMKNKEKLLKEQRARQGARGGF